MVNSAKRRERDKRKKQNKEDLVQKTPTPPPIVFPPLVTEWQRHHFLEYHKNEPPMHEDLQKSGYIKERGPDGMWYFRSPGIDDKSGRVFVPGSERLKTKSIPRHVQAATNVLQEPSYLHPTPVPSKK